MLWLIMSRLGRFVLGPAMAAGVYAFIKIDASVECAASSASVNTGNIADSAPSSQDLEQSYVED